MAYWTSCRISPGDCENTKTSSQLPAEITQSAQTNTVVQSRDIPKCHQQQTVNTDQDKDLTLNPRPPLTLRKRSRVTMVRGPRHVPPIVGLHRPGSAAHPVRGQMSPGLLAGVTSQRPASCDLHKHWNKLRWRVRGEEEEEEEEIKFNTFT